ncbi:hypothetical protein LO763_07365 [Glycomyces sp. A-F 0318]|uniref:hypothetical protein n=1 Tax=Glycomyces amatae TaxID=2881355 RepID=UPI001E4A5656|nr:hypothetical protein [Glycomyces amatae]MCD0443443.1 hypothetical protein [Glycomyces amatae]
MVAGAGTVWVAPGSSDGVPAAVVVGPVVAGAVAARPVVGGAVELLPVVAAVAVVSVAAGFGRAVCRWAAWCAAGVAGVAVQGIVVVVVVVVVMVGSPPPGGVVAHAWARGGGRDGGRVAWRRRLAAGSRIAVE